MEEKVSKEVVRMPSWNQSAIEGKIATLNKRAVKLGCREMVLSFVGAEPMKVTHARDGRELTTPMYVPMLDATLEYVIPRVNGYRVVAGMDLIVTDKNSVVLVSPVPGESIPAKFQSLEVIRCDHCSTERYRKHSILLQHDDGHYKQVGTSCVKDFFGHDPKGLLMMASIVFGEIVRSISDDDDGYYPRNNRDFVVELKDLLSVASAVIRNFGWLGRGSAYDIGGMATVDIALTNMYSENVDSSIRIDGVIKSDKELAEKTIEYFQDLDPGDNEYQINCCKIADLGFVHHRYQGYAASMVFSYQLSMKRKAESADLPESSWVGNVGERLKSVPVNVLFRLDLDSDYGINRLYTFSDESGNEFKTYYSGGSWEAESGDSGLLTGTVKGHDTYNDRKQTNLTRVSFKQAGVIK